MKKPSDSYVNISFDVKKFNGQDYVPLDKYNELIEKMRRAKDTINYAMDKWFEALDLRMEDQKNLVKMIERVEKANNRADRLVLEIEKLRRSQQKTQLVIGESVPAFKY